MPVLGAMVRIALAIDRVVSAQLPTDPRATVYHAVLQNRRERLEKSHRPFSNPSFLFLCKDFLSKPSPNPSEIELGSEVTLKDFPYVNYSQPRSGAEVGAHHLQMGSAPGALCKSPSSGRCRFGLIKSYTEPVYLSLWRILGNFDFLAISELLTKGKLKTFLILMVFLALASSGQLHSVPFLVASCKLLISIKPF